MLSQAALLGMGTACIGAIVSQVGEEAIEIEWEYGKL